MVRNAAVEGLNNTITIKAAVQPESGSRHPKTFMGMLEGNPSTQISGLGSSFIYDKRNSMVSETMEEHALNSAEAAYKDLGEQVPM